MPIVMPKDAASKCAALAKQLYAVYKAVIRVPFDLNLHNPTVCCVLAGLLCVVEDVGGCCMFWSFAFAHSCNKAAANSLAQRLLQQRPSAAETKWCGASSSELCLDSSKQADSVRESLTPDDAIGSLLRSIKLCCRFALTSTLTVTA